MQPKYSLRFRLWWCSLAGCGSKWPRCLDNLNARDYDLQEFRTRDDATNAIVSPNHVSEASVHLERLQEPNGLNTELYVS
jgi:hypothetical protein